MNMAAVESMSCGRLLRHCRHCFKLYYGDHGHQDCLRKPGPKEPSESPPIEGKKDESTKAAISTEK